VHGAVTVAVAVTVVVVGTSVVLVTVTVVGTSVVLVTVTVTVLPGGAEVGVEVG